MEMRSSKRLPEGEVGTIRTIEGETASAEYKENS